MAISNTDKEQSNIDKSKLTRHVDLPYLQAKRKATEAYNKGGLSGKLGKVFSALATARVLTTIQLKQICNVSPRSLKRYQSNYWIYGTPIPSNLTSIDPTFSPKMKDYRLYTLSCAGYELAKQYKLVHNKTTGYDYSKTVHDVLCNEIALRLRRAATEQGIECEWLGSYESRIYDTSGKVLIVPDAFMMFKTLQNTIGCAIEYHNEDNSTRSEDKVSRYEAQAASQNWGKYWKEEHPPTVLVAFTHKAVYTGYIEALKWRYDGQHNVRCQYRAMSLKKALSYPDMFEWVDLNKRAQGISQKVNLLAEV